MSCYDRKSLGFIAEEIITVCTSLSPHVVNNAHAWSCSLQKDGMELKDGLMLVLPLGNSRDLELSAR